MTKEQSQLFYSNLEKAIAFHELNQNDPHNVGNAVLVALREVKDAFGFAMKNEGLPQPTLKL